MALSYQDQRLIEESRLPRRLRTVALVLARIYNPKGKIFISIKELAGRAGSHPTRVSHACAELHDLGIFPRLRNGGRHSAKGGKGKIVNHTALRTFVPDALKNADRFATYADYQKWARERRAENRDAGIASSSESLLGSVGHQVANPPVGPQNQVANPLRDPATSSSESATHKALRASTAPRTEKAPSERARARRRAPLSARPSSGDGRRQRYDADQPCPDCGGAVRDLPWPAVEGSRPKCNACFHRTKHLGSRTASNLQAAIAACAKNREDRVPSGVFDAGTFDSTVVASEPVKQEPQSPVPQLATGAEEDPC